MGVYTHIAFLNANDPEFVKATNGTPKQREEWEDENYPIEDRPGAKIDGVEDVITETNDEYGGWLIDVKYIPKEATHIIVYRG
jgi:hypothetical protein